MAKFTKTHGLTNHPIFGLWSRMKSRCYSIKPNNISAKYYRNKGINVCDYWRYNFNNFYDWSINNGWFKGCSIDRINPNGDYEPSNCQFITRGMNSKKVSLDNPMLNRGENCKWSKVVENEVLEIRKLRMSGSRLKDISDRYGISLSVISAICRNKSWKHIENLDAKKVPRTRHSKLSTEKVIEIKKLLQIGARGDHLAQKFGVTKSVISSIKNGKTWSHVQGV